MKNLLFFSNNKNKISEVKKLFKDSGITLYSLEDFKKIKEPKETGNTFVENAKIKSICGYNFFKMPCFADDSGICINVLNDKPGVKSKRFFSKFLNKKNAFNYILNRTKESKNKIAYFKTSICLTLNESEHIIFEGRINGTIADFPLGKNGFGYDSIFIPNGQTKTYGQMTQKQKNTLSHRSVAINKLLGFVVI